MAKRGKITYVEDEDGKIVETIIKNIDVGTISKFKLDQQRNRQR